MRHPLVTVCLLAISILLLGVAASASEQAAKDRLDEALRRGCLWAYYPESNVAEVAVDLSASRIRLPDAAELGKGVTSATVRVLPADGGDVLGRTTLPVQAGRAQAARLELPPLEGRFVAEFTLQGDAAALPRNVRVPFERVVYPWEGNNLGVTDEVFEPFKPVQAGEDGRVGIVGRTYQLDGLGLMRSVTAEGQELMASPMILRYELQDGTQGVVEPGQSRRVSATDAAAIYAGSGASAAVRIDASAEVEFDGMVKLTWTLAPTGDRAELKRLWLEIPLQRSLTPLMHQTTDTNRIHHSGYVPGGEGVVWTSVDARRQVQWQNTFNAYLWLGDAGPGLAWFAENDKGWLTERGGSRKPIQQVVRAGEVHRIEVMFCNTPSTLEEPTQIVFGLQASPSKPMPQGWRAAHPAPPGVSGPVNPWGGIQCAAKFPYRDDWAVVDKVIEARQTDEPDEAWFKEYAAKHNPPLVHGRIPWHERTAWFAEREARLPDDYPTLVYFEEMRASPLRPEWQTFQDQWGNAQFTDRQWPDESIMRQGFNASPNVPVTFTQSYRDYGAWYANQWLERGIGLYWDNTYPQPGFDPVTTNAYLTDDGQVQPAMTLFAQRDYHKRIWNLLHQRRADNDTGRPLHWSVHMTSTLLLPIHTFATIQLDHEFALTEPAAPDYIRTEMIGRQAGNFPHALYPVSGSLNSNVVGIKQEHRDRIEWGMRRVHEVLPGPHFMTDGGPLEAVLRGFGYGKGHVEVHPYWNASPVARTTAETTRWLALHDTQTERWLIVLASWDADREQAEVTLDPSRTSGPLAFSDAETGRPLDAPTGHAFTADLARPYGVRLILAYPADRDPQIDWPLRSPEAVAVETAEPVEGDRIVGKGKTDTTKTISTSTAPDDPMRGVDATAVLIRDDFEVGFSDGWARTQGVQVVEDETGNRVARFTAPRQRLASKPLPTTPSVERDAMAEEWSDYAVRFRVRVGDFKEDETSSSPVATWLQFDWRSSELEEGPRSKQTTYLQMWRANQTWRIAGPYVGWNGKNTNFPRADVAVLPAGRGETDRVTKVDADWHEVEVRVLGERTQIRFDDEIVFDGTDDRARYGAFTISALWDERAMPAHLDVDDVVAWKIDTMDAAPLQRMPSLRISEAPTIDGALEDAAWQQAREAGDVIGDWVQVGKLGVEATRAPFNREAWLTYDDEHLYVAMRAEAEDPMALVVEPQGDPFRGDGLEVHLSDLDGRYVHLGVDVANNLRPGNQHTVGPASGVEHAAVYTADGWATELAIPWALLDIDPADRPDLRINLAANMASQGRGSQKAITATPGVFDIRTGGATLAWEPVADGPSATDSLRVARVDQPPTLDGVLDEAIWTDNPSPIQLQPVGDAEGPRPAPRTVALAADDKHLYVAMKQSIAGPDAIRIDPQQPEAGDTLRLDFAGHALGSNALGAPLQILLPYQIPFEARGIVGDDEWTLEMAIPWAQIGGRPQPGASIPFNVTGNASDAGLVTWMPIQDPRDFEQFGTLIINEGGSEDPRP